MKPTDIRVTLGMDAFTKTLRGLIFYDVGEKAKGGKGISRNNKPFKGNKDMVRFMMERKFLHTQCDPILEYINLLDQDEREGFIGIMMTRIQGLEPFSAGVAIDSNALMDLRIQWEAQVSRFEELTGFKRG